MATDKRVRQRENREKLRAERSRLERIEKMKRRGVILIVILAVVATFAWLTNRQSGVTETPAATLETSEATLPSVDPSPSDYAGFRAQPTACGAEQPEAIQEMSFLAPVDQGLTGTVQAVLHTSCGHIDFSLDAAAAPESVNSFAFLASEGYFDGSVCHRLVPGFVLQCGDQTATGGGDPGYALSDEFPAEGFVYGQGVVAMANAGVGTTGSQFFLVIGDGSFLPASFSVLGTFSDPEGTLAALAAVPLGVAPGGERSGPLETIYLNSVVVGG